MGNSGTGAERQDEAATAKAERYLAEVDSALAARGVVDRVEIVAGLREHILAAAEDSAPGDTSGVDAILRELGDPLAIAAEAAPDETASTPARRLSGTWVPFVALGLVLLGSLLVGFVVPVILLLAGLVLVWASPLWDVSEKALATVLTPAPGVALWILLGAATAQQCESVSTGIDVQTTCSDAPGVGGGVVATIVLVAVMVAGVVVTGILARRALARARG